MPTARITCCDGVLRTAVIDQISGSPISPKPTSSARRAASVAYPRCQAARARRHPTSMPPKPGTPGGIGLRPVNPMNAPVSSRSKAHNPKPWASKSPSKRSTLASLALRSSAEGKKRITSGSALSAAYGARSLSCQRRISSRDVRIS